MRIRICHLWGRKECIYFLRYMCERYTSIWLIYYAYMAEELWPTLLCYEWRFPMFKRGRIYIRNPLSYFFLCDILVNVNVCNQRVAGAKRVRSILKTFNGAYQRNSVTICICIYHFAINWTLNLLSLVLVLLLSIFL